MRKSLTLAMLLIVLLSLAACADIETQAIALQNLVSTKIRPIPRPTYTPRPTITPRSTATPHSTSTPTPTVTPIPATATPAKATNDLSEVARGKSGKKQVAITLDAGAGSAPFPKMLTALTNANVKITFFLTGQWAQQNPTFVEQIVANGHEIANHSWSHPDFTKLSDEAIKTELEKTESLLSKFTGTSTKPLWRPPFGAYNAKVLSTVAKLGYRSIMWTIDSLDSIGQPKTRDFLVNRITSQTDAQLDGEIILMHIGNPTTADALPLILENLRKRGFTVVTITKLLN